MQTLDGRLDGGSTLRLTLGSARSVILPGKRPWADSGD